MDAATIEDTLATASALVVRLRGSTESERGPIRKELTTLASGELGGRVREQLSTMKRGELLEIQWEIDDILEATTPKRAAPPEPEPAAEPEPAPEPEPETPPDDPNRPLTAADLTLVYDDPRGLMLHKSKVGERWFATQVDPRTGQPQTFELHPSEVEEVKGQLKGSPYWLVGG